MKNTCIQEYISLRLLHTYIHTYKHTYISLRLLLILVLNAGHCRCPTYIHTCIHTYIHTLIYTYISTSLESDLMLLQQLLRQCPVLGNLHLEFRQRLEDLLRRLQGRPLLQGLIVSLYLSLCLFFTHALVKAWPPVSVASLVLLVLLIPCF